MKKLKNNKKILLIIFSMLLIAITSFCIAINKKGNVFYNLVHKQEKLADDEIELDNWEISTVFYDSTIDNGNTPLTEINWDASDGGYKIGTTRIITVQINYKNTNTVNDYEPRSLEIKIPNIVYGEIVSSYNSMLYTKAFLGTEITVSANDSTHSNYDWDFKPQKSSWFANGLTNRPMIDMANYYFTNKYKVEKNTNFEGSIQIQYTLTPMEDTGNKTTHEIGFQEECTHTINKSVKAILNNKIESNETNFKYTRTYVHPWEKSIGAISKTASPITSLDGLENANDYIWVKYSMQLSDFTYYNSYPKIKPSKIYIIDQTPENCIVYDSNLNKIEGDKVAELEDPGFNSSFNRKFEIIVGYPKSIYNSSNNNLNITNKAKLYADYQNGEKDIYNDESEISIDLSNFEYHFNGSLYKIKKDFTYTKGLYIDDSKTYYQSLTGEDTLIGNRGNLLSSITPDIVYNGKKFDAKIADDVLFISSANGDYRKLEPDEYYITKIEFSNLFKNGNNVNIEEGKYEVDLWIKKDSSNYEKYDTFFNTEKTWEFRKNDKVTAFYFYIKNVDTSLISNNASPIKAYYTINNARDISVEGKIYNFSYLEVYYENEIQNQVTIEDYPNELKDIITNYDIDNYGHYVQRAIGSNRYINFTLKNPKYAFHTEKFMNNVVQDAVNEKFIMKNVEIRGSFITKEPIKGYEHLANQYNRDYGIKEFYLFDLLPKGMKMESSPESIINSINFRTNGNYGSYLCLFNKDINYIKEHTTVDIIENWNNTGRTLLKIHVNYDESFLLFTSSTYMGVEYEFYYNSSVSYDDFLENGNEYTNTVYGEFINNTNSMFYDDAIQDNGTIDSDAIDINGNGIITDTLSHASRKKTITSVIATNQDVQTSVKTNKSNFTTGRVDTSLDSIYSYKLRVRNGQNDVTNLVIYDSIEAYAKDSEQNFVQAYGAKKFWQGEFLGVDTSYAESKGYRVKVYYSESAQPGSLKDDNSWQEYTDSIDKSKVKSLAFEYLDENNQPAILPANSLTYVLINMKSPSEEFKTFAYNGCWTEWNAIAPITNQPVDFITGINSNIARVGLPSSVEPEDIELTLTKKWIDNSNSLGKRPENVTFRIIPNDDYSKATEVTFSGTGNTWTYNVTVPKYDDDGEEIEYTIKEDTINLEENYKYVPSVDNFEVTNTLHKELTLTKKWLDNYDAYFTRPSSVVFNVLQNGNNYKSVSFGGELTNDEWTKTISVPVYDDNNEEYVYTIEEVDADNYTATCENLECTNLLTDDYKITITKEWIDDNNSYNTRPSSITVKLKQNGEDYQDVTLTGNDNTWESDEITVPMYDDNGIKYTYTIIENTIPSYGLVSYDQENFKITNTLKETTLLTITKKWLDKDNEYNTRPDNLEITLLQNGNNYQTLTFSGDTDTWTTTIEVPKYDDNQKEYTYSIKEINDNLEDYQDITYSDDELSVTNKLKKNINLKVTKKWIDHDNEYQTRPSKITVKLLQDGEEYQDLELSGDGNTWETSIEVPLYGNDSNKHIYTIKELDPIDNYKKITYDQTTYTITNELTDIPKVTLYFTVLNGYVEPGTTEIKYDEEGFRETLRKHGIDPDSDYEFTFELQNIETNEIYEGKLSTKGILQFEDIPYGDYRALEGNDDIFEFVSMESIGEVLGVKFTPGKNGGIISIRPTGQDIIYGANIINKVSAPMKNPNTSSKTILLVTSIILLVVSLITVLLMSKRISKRFILPTIKIF